MNKIAYEKMQTKKDNALSFGLGSNSVSRVSFILNVYLMDLLLISQSGPILSCDQMKATRGRFKMFGFSVMQSTFCFFQCRNPGSSHN